MTPSSRATYCPKDVKCLVEQDFILMFGEETSSKLLERWPVMFKKKIIQQCRKLPTTSELEELLLAADPPEDGTEVDVDFGWDSDLSSILLLLHLIPPSAQGRKRPGKVLASQAEKHLVVFKRTGTNIQEHIDAITTRAQPHLLAVGVELMGSVPCLLQLLSGSSPSPKLQRFQTPVSGVGNGTTERSLGAMLDRTGRCQQGMLTPPQLWLCGCL
ncbi:uncharacterized protein LOC131992914 [Centropristis striata]|uniref:uncharacterized protein LOC131992914 n=1 Tax=Centropristis striata TaxID=184440 RepID=UPI0027E1D290|nr:uncharacterized protein LOC131992914 [Centropristis striata]